MLFNSAEFLRFFGIFLACYAVVRHSLAARNALITVASYLFYAGWDYRFTALLFFTTLVDFSLGKRIHAEPSARRRKAYLACSLISNLAVLGFFKYADFAIESTANMLSVVGIEYTPAPLGIVLPVGISFYTFQSVSYTVDVYRGSIPAERSFMRFAGYVAFFPQLVAGPIERADRLLPQFQRSLNITSEDIVTGFSWMVQGLFKKVVIADNVGRLVELSHNTPGMPAPILVIGTLAFGFQIYCDFSGYSDIARGVARWLGFQLTVNFDSPYLATNIRQFWRRWHISLSTWLRDYVYIPLGGNRYGTKRMFAALLATMALGGLWHGASLNFLLWGIWHGLALVVCHLWSRNPVRARAMPVWIAWPITMLTVFYGWLLFRASSTDDLWAWHSLLISDWRWPEWGFTYAMQVALFTVPVLLAELAGQLGWINTLPERFRVPAHVLRNAAFLLGVFVFWTDDPPAFIYFQF